MSNIFQSANLEKDYLDFEKGIFKTNKIKYSLTPELKPHLKKYHRLTYVIALLGTKVSSKWPDEGNRFLFINEMLSDLLSISSVSIIGFHYSSNILTRRFIENFYNHVFYFEHPVEFELLNMGRNEYTSINDLKIYYEAHPVISQQKDLNIKPCNDTLYQHYQELCRTVHTKGEAFMGLAKNLEEIKPDVEIGKYLDQVNKSISNTIYLLFKFHRDIDFSHTEKDTVAKSFPKNLRTALLS